MKKVLFFVFSMLSVSMSAQIVEFTEDVLSQYNNKKQEAILTKSIELDSLYIPLDLTRGKIFYEDKYSEVFSYHNENEVDRIPNYIGYHVYIPESKKKNRYTFSCSSNFDTFAFDIIPKGIYEVVGMLISSDDWEELERIIEDPTTIIKNNSIEGPCHYCPPGNWRNVRETYTNRELMELYCEKQRKIFNSTHEINRKIHNKENIETSYATLVLKGDDNYQYYIDLISTTIKNGAGEIVYIRDFNGAFIVEQYEYIKEFLLKNDFLFQSDNNIISITTDDGLNYDFPDTIGFNICDLAVKDGKFIAIMKIGSDSILYHHDISWENKKFCENKWCADKSFYSDTVEYINVHIGKLSILRKCDIERIRQVKMDLANRVIMCESLQAEELERARQEELAAQKAEQERRQKEWETLQRELERQRKTEKQSLIAQYGEKFGTLVFENKVTLGMTKEMCLKAWGRPRNKTITKIEHGIQEIWYYGTVQYLVFENGVLVECASKS